MKKFWSNPVTIWLALTGIYLLLQGSPDISPRLPFIQYMVGIFVPFGMMTFVYGLLGNTIWIFLVPIVTLVVLLIFAHYIKNYNFSTYKKILFTLLILAILTFLSDMIFFHTWTSLGLLLSSLGFKIALLSL